MRKLAIEVGTAEAFFARGRKLAHLADRGERLPESRTLTFEDPADFLAQAGFFVVLDKPLPEHGRMKEVRVSARKVSLRAEVA